MNYSPHKLHILSGVPSLLGMRVRVDGTHPYTNNCVNIKIVFITYGGYSTVMGSPLSSDPFDGKARGPKRLKLIPQCQTIRRDHSVSKKLNVKMDPEIAKTPRL